MPGVFRKLVLPSAVALLLLLPLAARADDVSDIDPNAPPTLAAIQNAQPVNPVTPQKDSSDGSDSEQGLPSNIRASAIKEAALSYGARGGLAYRTYLIRKQVEMHASYFDKVFDFRQLLIPAPSGLLIEPPIISEADNNMIIADDGQTAAVADRLYEITMNAKIVAAPRLWREYIERDWGEVTPPPDILLPQTPQEKVMWDKYTAQGWKKGFDQADEIFQTDLNQLTADYKGMVRYRMLLAQGMVSAPYALQTDRGVTGDKDGHSMRVGDRAIQITGAPALKTGTAEWQPASR